jgi:D-mannonate dehydratase
LPFTRQQRGKCKRKLFPIAVALLVIPAAADAGVRVAIHPRVPAVPRGAGLDDHALGDIDGLKRFCDPSPSPYDGLNFRQGCTQQSGSDQESLIDAIRYFGQRNVCVWSTFARFEAASAIFGRPLSTRVLLTC